MDDPLTQLASAQSSPAPSTATASPAPSSDGDAVDQQEAGTAASASATSEPVDIDPNQLTATSTPVSTPAVAPRGAAGSTVLRRVQEFSSAAHCGADARVAVEGGLTCDLARVRELAFDGVPDTALMRGVYWRLLLDFLPPDRQEWETAVKQKRELYQTFVDDLTLDPSRAAAETGEDIHPLQQTESVDQKKTVWEQYFEDSEIVEEVDKDVKRTLPHLHFFNSDPSTGSTEHYEALKRILFVYAKLNPGVRYVQGMNEILGPLYYVVVAPGERQLHKQQQSDAEGGGISGSVGTPGVGKETAALLFPESKPGEIGGCEADAFFCFTSLMAEIRDNFIKTLDRSDSGVQGSIRRFEGLLRRQDEEVWTVLERQGINPQFYSFRWITLLLSQEFDLPDVLRLWDSCFADENRFEFFYFVCIAMLSTVREELLDGDFANNLKTLQNYPVSDVNVLIKRARDIRAGMWHPPPFREGFEPLKDRDTRQYAVSGGSSSGDRKKAMAAKKAPPQTNYSSWGSTISSLFGGGKAPRRPVASSAPARRQAEPPSRPARVSADSGPSGSDLVAKARAAPATDLFGSSALSGLTDDDTKKAASAPLPRKAPQPAPASSSESTPDPEPVDAAPRDDGGADPLAGIAYKAHPLE